MIGQYRPYTLILTSQYTSHINRDYIDSGTYIIDTSEDYKNMLNELLDVRGFPASISFISVAPIIMKAGNVQRAQHIDYNLCSTLDVFYDYARRKDSVFPEEFTWTSGYWLHREDRSLSFETSTVIDWYMNRIAYIRDPENRALDKYLIDPKEVSLSCRYEVTKLEKLWSLLIGDPTDPNYISPRVQYAVVCEYAHAYANLCMNGYPSAISVDFSVGNAIWADEPDYCEHGVHDIIDALYLYAKQSDEKLHPNFMLGFRDFVSHPAHIVIQYRMYNFIKMVGLSPRPDKKEINDFVFDTMYEPPTPSIN